MPSSPSPSLLRQVTDLAEEALEELRPPSGRLPVYALDRLSVENMESLAEQLVIAAERHAGLNPGTIQLDRINQRSRLVSTHQTRAEVFHASGAVNLRTALPGYKSFVALNDRTVTSEILTARALELTRGLGLFDILRRTRLSRTETHAFERVFQIKGSATPLDGDQGTPAVHVSRAVGAFRRAVGGVPVLGRASVFVKFGADNALDSLGIDWRPIRREKPRRVPLLLPRQAAADILRQLGSSHPDLASTGEHYTPVWLRLGYVSFSKYSNQRYLEPTWLALLRPNSQEAATIAHLVIVPASKNVHERPLRPSLKPLELEPRPVRSPPRTQPLQSASRYANVPLGGPQGELSEIE